MKKILACIFVTLFLCVILCSCGQQNMPTSVAGQSVSSSSTNAQASTGNVPDYATLAEPKDGKEAISVVSFSSEWHTDMYSHAIFTVKNDLEITVREIWLYLVYLDKNGSIIGTGNATADVRVLPGQSITVYDAFYNSLNAASVYIDQYSYYDKDNTFHKFFVDNPEIFPIQ